MKSKVKKHLAFILVITSLFTLTNITAFADITDETVVNGIHVGNDNYTSEDNSIIWDHDTTTLTLNNAHLTDWSGFYFQKPAGSDWNTRPEGLLTIILKGDNTIDSSHHGIVCNGDMDIIAEPGASITINASLVSQTEDRSKYDASSCIGGYNVNIKGGTYNLKTMGGCITADGTLNIENADITAQSDNGTPIYADKDINIKGNSTLDVTALEVAHNYHFEDSDDGQIQVDDPYNPLGIFAVGGSLNITGSGNHIEVNTLGCAMEGYYGVTIADGAEVTASSKTDVAIFSASGNLTVDGKGTALTLDSPSAVLRTSFNGRPETAGDIMISGGANVTGTSGSDSAIYTPYGNITVKGADTVVDLTAYYCGLQSGNGYYYDPANYYDITIADGASVTATSSNDSAIFDLNGSVNIESGASLTVPSANQCAILTGYGAVNISGKGTALDLKSTRFASIQGNGGINIKDGANLTAGSDSGCALFSPSDITVDGKETTLNLNSYYAVIQTVDAGNPYTPGNITISGGAKVTGYSSGDSAVLTLNGDIAVKGAGTTLEINTPYAVIQAGAVITIDETETYSAVCNVEISDGASVTGTSATRNAIYIPNGSLTIDGADTAVDLNAAFSGVWIEGEGDVKISGGADVTATAAECYGIYTNSGDIEISGGASITVPSANYNAIGSNSGNITITGAGTVADVTVKNIYSAIQTSGNIDISDGANVTGKADNSGAIWSTGGNAAVKGVGTTLNLTSKLNGMKAVDVEISDGANVTIHSTDGNAICTDKGNIVLNGKDTSVECASTNGFAIYNADGVITLNAGHTIAETSTGPAAVMASRISESDQDAPPPAIVIGDGYIADGLKAAATAWSVQFDDRYRSETVLVPKDTVLLNGQGLLDDGYVAAKKVEIIKAYILGDVNDDKTVDFDDVDRMLQHLVFPEQYQLNQEGDFNQDGQVDFDDADRLLQHLVFPDIWPLG